MRRRNKKSDGAYQMGPAYIPFVKTNFELDNPKNYDAKFVAGEVNRYIGFQKATIGMTSEELC